MTPEDASTCVREICGLAPVIPVIVVAEVTRARPLAEVLVAGGLPVLEVTLRTPGALDAIRAMTAVPGGIVGAGTLVTAADVRAAKAAGARFGVSPGVTPALIDACEAEDLPLLGGVATASEAMALLARGYDTAKFFPAGPSGGAPVLKAFAGPLPQMGFCPTGGIGFRNAGDYLSLPNVLCVGGSWVCDPKLVAEGRWDEIGRLAAEARGLRDT